MRSWRRDRRPPVEQAVGVTAARERARRRLRLLIGAAVASVAAACAGLSDFTGPTPVESDIASIDLSTREVTIGAGSTVTLQFSARDADGRAVTDRVVRWSSSDTMVVRVNESGVLTAVDAGRAQVAVSMGGRSATAQVTVVPRPVTSLDVLPANPALRVGEVLQFTVVARDELGLPLAGRVVAWSSSNSAIATVDATGFVSALSPGVVTITATSEGRSTAVGVVISPVPVARVDVSPASERIVVGQTTQLTGVARDANGVPLDRPLNWSTSAAAVATVSADGLVIAIAPGRATITAEHEGTTGTAVVDVDSRPIGAVIVSPAQATLSEGEQLTLSVQVTDGSGNLLTGRPLTFSSGNPSSATVDANGAVRAIAAGSATITVRSEGQEGTMRVTVLPTPVASVRIEPANDTLAVGDSVALRAIPLDASGAPLPASSRTTWTSGAPTVVSISSNGVVRALSPGTGLVFAVVDGRLATARVHVAASSVGSVTLTPAVGSIVVDATIDLVATVRSATGEIITGRIVQFSSSAPNVAVVSSSGRVRALSLGSTRIDATVDGVTASANISVVPAPVATVRVTIASASIAVGSTTTATVLTLDAAGNVLPGRAVVWSSSNVDVATVSATGEVRAVGIGTATITVTSEGVSGSATITVSPIPVGTVRVTLPDSSLTVGQTVTGTAEVRSAGGAVLPGRVVTWSSSDTLVARVSATGVVTGRGVGSATITATSEGVSGSVAISVAPAPVASIALSAPDSSLIRFDTIQVTAVLRDAANNVLTGRTIAWSSSNTSVATVSSTGRVIASGIGSATITATSEGVSRTLALTVAPAPVATIAVTLGSSSVQAGNTTQATAELRDARGNVLTGRTVVWASNDASVATVNSTTGLVSAVAAGSTSITATSEGITGGATVTVTAAPPAPVASITLSTPDSSLIQFDTVQVTAVLRDADENELTGRSIAWSSSNTAIATVSSTGEVAAVAVGSATITATSEGISETLDLTIAPAPVATIAVTLTPPSVQAGNTTQATAELRDARNNVLTDRTITWTSDNAPVATVNSTTGLVSAVSAGSASITATSEGITGNATVTVTAAPPAPVATIELSTPDSSLIQFDTVQVTAVLRDADENELTGRTITWSSSNIAIATVSTSGEVAAVGVGSATITATSEGISETLDLTIAPAPVATIAVTLTPPSVQAGNTTQATAELRDARNNVLTDRTITWTSDNAPVATVNSTTGLVSAVAAGSASITATSEGITGNATVTVTAASAPPAPVASIELSTPDSSLIQFDTVQVTAVLRDADENELTGRPIVWSSSNAAIATVSRNGEVAAVGVGSATITAMSEGIRQTLDLTIAPAPVSRVSVSLASPSIEVGNTTEATAVLRDARNNVLTDRTVTWSSTNAVVATVNEATGLVTAVSAGTATITATSEGATNGALLTVTVPPPLLVETITLTVPDSSLVQYDTVRVTVDIRDPAGRPITGRVVTWASSDPLVATVSDSGVVIAVGEGEVRITATSEGVEGTLDLTVTAPAVASITVTLPMPTLLVGEVTRAIALLLDARGNEVTGRAITWRTRNQATATVSASGDVTGRRMGTTAVIATSEGVRGETNVRVRNP